MEMRKVSNTTHIPLGLMLRITQSLFLYLIRLYFWNLFWAFSQICMSHQIKRNWVPPKLFAGGIGIMIWYFGVCHMCGWTHMRASHFWRRVFLLMEPWQSTMDHVLYWLERVGWDQVIFHFQGGGRGLKFLGMGRAFWIEICYIYRFIKDQNI